jgi:hypothetical protein
MKKILFKDLEKGKSFLLNGLYAIKVDSKRILVSKYGSDGFIDMNENDELEMYEDDEE